MTKGIDIISPSSISQFKKYYKIRFQELREPWGQPVGSEKDSIDDNKKCIHRLIEFKSEYVGVARLQYNSDQQGQIRYMAIKREYQRRGLGRLLIRDLESIAIENDIQEIILQSRDTALKFYLELDYKIVKKTHLLFNDIQHFLMRKYL